MTKDQALGCFSAYVILWALKNNTIEETVKNKEITYILIAKYRNVFSLKIISAMAHWVKGAMCSK